MMVSHEDVQEAVEEGRGNSFILRQIYTTLENLAGAIRGTTIPEEEANEISDLLHNLTNIVRQQTLLIRAQEERVKKVEKLARRVLNTSDYVSATLSAAIRDSGGDWGKVHRGRADSSITQLRLLEELAQEFLSESKKKAERKREEHTIPDGQLAFFIHDFFEPALKRVEAAAVGKGAPTGINAKRRAVELALKEWEEAGKE